MGCGCQKKAQAAGTPARNTSYQVLDSNNTVVNTFNTLAEARTAAQGVTGGRVRVASNTV